ncbi:MAG: ABC transporter substrate-binding protein [Gammaproteobacteria bacterium]
MRRLALACLVLLAACSDPGGEGPGAAPKIYTHAMDGAPSSLDPAQASSIYANFLVVNLYDTLYRYKYLARPYELTPNLAAALPEVSDDGLTITIPLKRGVRFIDDPAFDGGVGREVTAQDVVYSILRHFDPDTRAQGAWLWQGRIAGLDEWKAGGADYDHPVPGLQALDDHTLQIRLLQPFPQLAHTLAQGYAAVVPREAVERYGRELGTRPVGSGPFRLVAFDSSRAELARNPAFRAEPVELAAEGYDPATQSAYGLERLQGRTPPFVDRLVVEFIAEDAARWNAFLAGETQFIKVPAAQFDDVLDSRAPPRLAPSLADRFHLDASVESGFVYTNFNLADPAIGEHPDPEQARRNRALRCAIVKAFDWETRNERFFSGIGRVFPGIIPPQVPEFDPGSDLDYVRHDPEGARRLLREHGWTADNLPVLEYGFPASVTERQMFEQFRGFLEDIGYPREKIRPLTFATFGDYHRAYSQGEVTLITSSWTMDYPDAENTVQLFYGPNASPGSNSANFRNGEFDDLYRRAAALPPSPERTAYFRRMNRIVMDECATIAGLSRTLVFLWDRQAIMLPDRSFTGGYYLRFVDVDDHSEG